MLGSPPLFARRLLAWYRRYRRELPWRAEPVNPYHVLVSEAMLQQTQVATVVPYFERFVTQLPTVQALADADSQQILRLWQGLGYYSRARNLQRAAQSIVAEFGGQIPGERDDLLSLPGVGRYTAGAIASIAFGRRTPILDGNVARVLCRLHCIEDDPRSKSVRERLWMLAEEILPRKHLGDFNSALMELGATVCTPRSPKCDVCPVRLQCRALARGLQESIPPPKKSVATPIVHRRTFCIRLGRRYLIEQRPTTGRWAGMWQFVTREGDAEKGLQISRPRKIAQIRHTLTHRRYVFDVFLCQALTARLKGKWTTLEKLADYPLPLPHLKIAQMLREET